MLHSTSCVQSFCVPCSTSLALIQYTDEVEPSPAGDVLNQRLLPARRWLTWRTLAKTANTGMRAAIAVAQALAVTAWNAAASTAALAGTLITGKTVAAVAVLHASEVIICNTAIAYAMSLVIIEQITDETGAAVAPAQAGEPIGATGGTQVP